MTRVGRMVLASFTAAVLHSGCARPHLQANWYLSTDAASTTASEASAFDQCGQRVYLALLNTGPRTIEAKSVEVGGWKEAFDGMTLESGGFGVLDVGAFEQCRLPTFLTVTTRGGTRIPALIREPMPSALPGGTSPCCVVTSERGRADRLDALGRR